MGRAQPFPRKEVFELEIGRELTKGPVKLTGVDPRRDKDAGDRCRVCSRHIVVEGVADVSDARRVGNAQSVQTGQEVVDVRLSASNGAPRGGTSQTNVRGTHRGTHRAHQTNTTYPNTGPVPPNSRYRCAILPGM